MKRLVAATAVAIACAPLAISAQQPSSDGPYKVLMRAKVGGEGGTDYIYANTADRRLYITRNAVRAVAATDSTPARDSVPGRVTVFDLETLQPLGTILNGGGNGATVDAKTNHGFASSHPNISMFDTKSMQIIKTIDPTDGVQPPNPRFRAARSARRRPLRPPPHRRRPRSYRGPSHRRAAATKKPTEYARFAAPQRPSTNLLKWVLRHARD